MASSWQAATNNPGSWSQINDKFSQNPTGGIGNPGHYYQETNPNQYDQSFYGANAQTNWPMGSYGSGYDYSDFYSSASANSQQNSYWGQSHDTAQQDGQVYQQEMFQHHHQQEQNQQNLQGTQSQEEQEWCQSGQYLMGETQTATGEYG